MAVIAVRTQAALDKALAAVKPGDIIACVGSGQFSVSGSASVRAYGSASVTASGSASVTATGSASVTASGSASVRASGSASVWASDSASVRAYDSASVTASGSASVTAFDSASVWASRYVSVHTRAPSRVTVSGGVLIEVPPITTAQDWCEYHGVEVVDGVATLFKALDDDYSTSHARQKGLAYTVGTTVEAPDWDPEPECGQGLHYVPRPYDGLDFNPEATRFVACAVALADIVVHSPANYPNKVKAPRCTVTAEVDIHGQPVKAVAA